MAIVWKTFDSSMSRRRHPFGAVLPGAGTSAVVAAFAVPLAFAVQPACALFDRCSEQEATVQDAALDKAENDLDCKRADIATGVTPPGADTPTTTRAQGCGRSATYDCSHNDCGWSCTLRGAVQRP